MTMHGSRLSPESIVELHTAAVSLQLDRRSLLAGVSPSFVATIQTCPSYGEQIYVDLHTINALTHLIERSDPLRIWLLNAKTLAGPRPESTIFDKYIFTVLRYSTANPLDPEVLAQKAPFPLILRGGHVIESLSDLLTFARANPNAMGPESRNIALWLERIGYRPGERIELEMKFHLAALGVDPNNIPREAIPPFIAGSSRRSYTVYETDAPPDRPESGALWRNPIDDGLLVYVEAGEFVMGNDVVDVDPLLRQFGLTLEQIATFHDETPARLVNLSAFWIDKCAVTNYQFAEFLKSTSGRGLPTERRERYERLIDHAKGEGGQYPIHDISWFEAAAYCAWAGKSLPTEAQWEKAARGGTDNRIFPWGNNLNAALAQRLLNVFETSRPVPDGRKVLAHEENVSPFGCIQMAGNVQEWCADWYDPDAYKHGSAACPVNDPRGPQTSPDSARVARGGSTLKGIVFARCSARDAYPPASYQDFVGVRGVRNCR